MRIRISDLRLSLDADLEIIKQTAAKKAGVPLGSINQCLLVKQSLDARKKNNIGFVYTVDLEISDPSLLKQIRQRPAINYVEPAKQKVIARGSTKLFSAPVIVGAGPSGLFAAWKLAEYGYCPVILERGRDVNQRAKDVEYFWETGELNPNSNVQFGEGGAGTFSDGKLTTRSKDARVKEVLELLMERGAPEEILWVNKPHLGTDLLRKIVQSLRQKLLDLGAKIYFQSQVTDIILTDDRVAAVEINYQKQLNSQVVVLATGHSARDTYEQLAKKDFPIDPKPFAIGVRIEHPQKMIDAAQYGKFAGHPRLGAADYKLTYQSKEYRRGAYSFCMCPGGTVVAGASEPGMVVTNGMSEHARDSGKANSGLVVTIGTEDYPGDHALAGIEFQRQWEREAYRLGGGGFIAPNQSVEGFLADRADLNGAELETTYRPGVKEANLRECLPKEVGEVLAEALMDFNRKIKGYAGPDAVLTGVETRTSSPLRILRDDNCQVLGIEGLYPIGEGAGYAGGIISAAVDGLRAAEAIIRKYAPPREMNNDQ